MFVSYAVKKKIINITLIVMSAMVMLGVGLSIHFLTESKNVINVEIEPGETKAVSFEELCLRPGESCEYTITLDSEYSEKIRISLRFEDNAPALTLKNYVYVRVEKDGEVLCDELLAQMFERTEVSLSANFSSRKKNKLKIVYYMPEEISNEAQNAEADFKLLFTATNE